MAGARSRYSAVAIVLHWTIAAAIVFQVILGWRMDDDAKGAAAYAMFQLHKSVGVTILLLTLARLGWRIVNPPPPARPGQPRWEAIASHIVHFGLYAIMIGLPLTGWLMVSTSRVDIPTLLFHTVPWPHLPILHDLPPDAKRSWYDVGDFGHHALIIVTFALLFFHLGAVAKHQLIDRDETFGRMAPGARPGWGEPRQWLAGLALLGVIAAGYGFMPSIRAVAPAASVSGAPVAEPAPAQADAPAAPAEPGAAPVAWKLQPGSALRFTASWAGQPIDGAFKRWDADILFSPDALDASRLRVTVDIASASTGDPQRDFSLPTADWFDAAAHPSAVFEATHFRKTGEGRYEALGALDLRGVRKPVTVAFSLAIKDGVAIASGEATIDRTAFGVGQGDWASTDQIAAAVKVDFTLTAGRD
jgi:cytochrome b561/polyisoprenoid-binding protein YceI